jgi:hypothetical protein
MSLLEDQGTGRPGPFKIANAQATAFVVPPEHIAHLRGLLICDQSFGRTLPLTKSIPKCLKNLMTIISRERINCIFVVGDVIFRRDAIDTEKEAINKVVRAFEQFPIPVYISASEKTRPVLTEISPKAGSNVRIVLDYFLKLRHLNPPVGTPPNVFIASALLPQGGLQTDELPQFLSEFKEAFKAVIAPQDYLLLGGCHGYSLNEDLRCACVKEFSPDEHHQAYAIVVAESTGFEIRVVGK